MIDDHDDENTTRDTSDDSEGKIINGDSLGI